MIFHENQAVKVDKICWKFTILSKFAKYLWPWLSEILNFALSCSAGGLIWVFGSKKLKKYGFWAIICHLLPQKLIFCQKIDYSGIFEKCTLQNSRNLGFPTNFGQTLCLKISETEFFEDLSHFAWILHYEKSRKWKKLFFQTIMAIINGNFDVRNWIFENHK